MPDSIAGATQQIDSWAAEILRLTGELERERAKNAVLVTHVAELIERPWKFLQLGVRMGENRAAPSKACSGGQDKEMVGGGEPASCTPAPDPKLTERLERVVDERDALRDEVSVLNGELARARNERDQFRIQAARTGW